MRIFVTFFLLLVFTHVAQGQKFTLGVPIYDTIKKGSFWSNAQYTYLCPTAEVSIDTAIVNCVSGIKYYLLITGSALMHDSLRRVDNQYNDLGPINVGDSILLTHNTTNLNWQTIVLLFGSRTTTGIFSYAILASGTPTRLTDTFYCKEDLHVSGSIQIHNCNRLGNYYSCNLATCVVEEPLIKLSSGTVKSGDEISLLATTGSDVLRVKYALKANDGGKLLIFDQMGRTLASVDLPVSKTNTEVALRNVASGVYYYRFLVNGIARKGGRFFWQ